MLLRQLKDFGQGVGFGTAKVAQADDNLKSVIENALKVLFQNFEIELLTVFNALRKT
jgi:ATP-dependent Clp protease ATP-binding subunit ClpC